MSSAKPTKLTNLCIFFNWYSAVISIQFQPPSNILLPFLSTVTSPCTPTFPSSPTPTTHSLFSAPLSTSCHYLVPYPPSKVLPATPESLHVTGSTNITCSNPRSMWINEPEFTRKDNNEIASCVYSFFTFFIQLWIWSFVFSQGGFWHYVWRLITRLL